MLQLKNKINSENGINKILSLYIGDIMKEKVLFLLKEREHISGEKLSGIPGISGTAGWKAVNSLKDGGYDIDSVTNPKRVQFRKFIIAL